MLAQYLWKQLMDRSSADPVAPHLLHQNALKYWIQLHIINTHVTDNQSVFLSVTISFCSHSILSLNHSYIISQKDSQGTRLQLRYNSSLVLRVIIPESILAALTEVENSIKL